MMSCFLSLRYKKVNNSLSKKKKDWENAINHILEDAQQFSFVFCRTVQLDRSGGPKGHLEREGDDRSLWLQRKWSN